MLIRDPRVISHTIYGQKLRIHRAIGQGRLNIWTEDLKVFFLSWKLLEIWKNDTNIN